MPRCSQCKPSRSFIDDLALRQHQGTAHPGGNANKLPCNQCGRSFASNPALADHKRVAHGPNGPASPSQSPQLTRGSSYSCSQCERSFESQAALEQHRSTGSHVAAVFNTHTSRSPAPPYRPFIQPWLTSSPYSPSEYITRTVDSNLLPDFYVPHSPSPKIGSALIECSECHGLFESTALTKHILTLHAAPPPVPKGQPTQATRATLLEPGGESSPGESSSFVPVWKNNPLTSPPIVRMDETPLPALSPERFLYPSVQSIIGAQKGEVYREISRYPRLSEDDRMICMSSVEKIPIYPKLIALTYMHLALCAEDQSDLNELKSRLEDWRTWNDVECLVNHNTIKTFLAHRLQLFQSTNHQCPQTWDPKDSRKISKDDILSIGAHTATIFMDAEKTRDLLSRKDKDAQTLLDLLQALLDITDLDLDIRRQFRYALIKLSTKSGCVPQRLTLRASQLNYDEHKVIGKGSFGCVCEGKLLGRKVAVKILNGDELLKSCSREAAVWSHLTHPCILPFYGIYYSSFSGGALTACLVSPLMENTNIRSYLERKKETPRSPLILDIARGLQYLHESKPTIVHGDLKGANILVSLSGRACLADFGLSLAKDSQQVLASTVQLQIPGTLRWAPPERLDGGLAAKFRSSGADVRMSDIYSFACVCYEVYSGKDPFHEITDTVPLTLQIILGRRPTRPDGEIRRELDEGITWDMLTDCWHQEPKRRPTATQIVNYLERRHPTLRGARTVQEAQESEWSTSFLADLAQTVDHPFSWTVLQ
ncbi:kinase-like protein [Leucogyrophana mollusca]|uniref:Kinase-like protein n=1 Tax=Leucogyrophana mollusca TaxID=85980 RepID=A0ACB8BB55_9AGAM|nr:kinase-like protein [Leucogyrophana mollusca]